MDPSLGTKKNIYQFDPHHGMEIDCGLPNSRNKTGVLNHPRLGELVFCWQNPQKSWTQSGFSFLRSNFQKRVQKHDFRRCCDEYLATRPTETHATPAVPGHTPYKPGYLNTPHETRTYMKRVSYSRGSCRIVTSSSDAAQTHTPARRGQPSH